MEGSRSPDLDPHTGDTEEVDALIVPAGASQPHDRAPELPARPRSKALSDLRSAPAVQAAAVAAGGFVAGAAVVGIASRRRSGDRSIGRRGKDRRGKGGERLQIVGSRSLLVDVHLLGR